MTDNNIQKNKIISIYAISHAIVDFCCAAIVYSFIDISLDILLKLVILYNVLAFGLQFVFGFIADKTHTEKKLAVFGCILLIMGICVSPNPYLSVIIMGIGNAMFHAGGGVVSLSLEEGKASLAGIFVAPGALGLFAGTFWNKIFNYENVWLAFLPLIATAFLLFTDIPKNEGIPQKHLKKDVKYSLFGLVTLLILTAIVIRSFVGLSYNFSGKDNLFYMILFVFAVALGKFAGGFLSDKFGMLKTAVTGLILSIPFLKFGYIPILAMTGMFLFNLTMPITVTALANMMPKYKGLAFGLTTMALLIGFLPVYAGYKAVQSFLFFEIIIISVIVTAIALKLYEKLFDSP